MLLLPMTTRANFWATKFISLVVFEQLNIPNACGPCRSTVDRNAVAARSNASSQPAGRNVPPSRTSGSLNREYRPALVLDLIVRTHFPEKFGKIWIGILYANGGRTQASSTPRKAIFGDQFLKYQT
jgi:hypothetical protein